MPHRRKTPDERAIDAQVDRDLVVAVLDADGPMTFSAVRFALQYHVPDRRIHAALDALVADGTADRVPHRVAVGRNRRGEMHATAYTLRSHSHTPG